MRRITALMTALLFVVSLDAREYDPLQVKAEYNYIFAADLEDDFPGQEMSYSLTEVNATYLQPFCREYGALANVGFSLSHFGWSGNPEFHQSDFAYVVVGLGAYTCAIPNFLFTAVGNVNINTDITDHSAMLWEGVVYGRYSWHCSWLCDMNFYLGVYGDTGIEDSNLYPVAGVDFCPSWRWRFSAVFPNDISATYYFTRCLAVKAKTRMFFERYRLAADEPRSSGTIRYMNTGLEVAVVYEAPWRITADAHVGYALRGNLRVADSNGSNQTYFKTDDAPYLGAELSWKF